LAWRRDVSAVGFRSEGGRHGEREADSGGVFDRRAVHQRKNASDAIADCDTLFNRAVEAGGKVRRPLTNQFYGDRSGTVEDPFGQVWTISTHVEDVPPDELRRRMEAFAKS
jgi:predicted enzyme related to lactoylglutathione lyase